MNDYNRILEEKLGYELMAKIKNVKHTQCISCKNKKNCRLEFEGRACKNYKSR